MAFCEGGVVGEVPRLPGRGEKTQRKARYAGCSHCLSSPPMLTLPRSGRFLLYRAICLEFPPLVRRRSPGTVGALRLRRVARGLARGSPRATGGLVSAEVV
jgi:hypothetical protein